MDTVNSLLEEHKIAIALSLVGIILIVGGIFSSGLNNAKPTYAEESSKSETSSVVKVDVSGAVQSPAVYTLNTGSRLEDAVSAAGGFSDDSNQEYISKTLNLSQKLTDGQKIYVPFEGDNTGAATAPAGGAGGATLVSLNNASEAELEALPGVGPTTAQKIISGRPYSDISDLTFKKVVGQSAFSKIKDLVEVN